MFEYNGDTRISIVRHLAGEDFIEYDAETVNIRVGADFVSLGLLGTHVMWCANDSAGRCHTGSAGCGASYTEIGEYGRAVLTIHDIFGFDIAVHDAFFVSKSQRRSNLFHSGDAVAQFDALLDSVVKRYAARQIFHGNVVIAVVRSDIIDGNDMLMSEVGNDACLVQKAFTEAAVVLIQLAVHHFDGHLAVESDMAGQIYTCHATFADLSVYDIAG